MKSIFSLLSFNTCISDSIPLLRIVSLLFTYSFNNPNSNLSSPAFNAE